MNDYKWELYNLTEDFSQYNDLAAQDAGKAEGNAGVVPDGSGEVQRIPAGQLGLHAAAHATTERGRRTDVVHIFGENANIPVGNAPSILDRDYTITAEITVPKKRRAKA